MNRYPLLQSQLGVFLECQSFPESTQYNLPYHVILDRDENAEALAAAWKKLIHASGVMRTRFAIDQDGNPQQWPDDEMPVEIPIRHMKETEAEDYIHNGFVRRFDLLGGDPLFRVELIETEENLHMLLDFHHLIMDGFGYASVLERELTYFLNGKERPVDNSFFDIAQSESDYFNSEEYNTARAYFVDNFQGTEFTGLSNLSAALGQLVTHTEAISRQQCDAWCSANHVDIQSLFQAAFALALGRMARTQEPAYCTSYHARVNRRMMRTQGMFVNNVALKADLTPGSTVIDLLRAVEQSTATAYSMGRYPFTHFNRELGMVPRVSFNFRPFQQSLKIGGRKYPAQELQRGLAQTDINVHIEDAGDNYEICVESSDAVNSAEMVALFARAIAAVLRNMMEKPDRCLREIALVREEEALRLLKLSTGEQKPYDTSKIWLDHFKEQVALHGDCTAVVDGQGAYSYAQLDALSDSVARYLIDHAVLPNDFVAVKTERTKDFMAAVLGIWKAGAAYIPIDADYPAERVSFMLSDSGAKLLLEDETIKEAEKTEAGEPVCLATPASHAYVIYTSGSTGQPKGVVIPQSAMLNLVSFIRDRWGHTQRSRIACHSNFSFDASVEDLYPVLMTGGTLYIVPEEVRRDLLLMRSYIRDNGITGGCYTTQFGQLLGDVEEPLELDYIVLGGEKMTSVPNITGTVYNTYGPTEFTVDATYCVVEDQDEYADIPIGRALYNCSALVLDSCGNLLPQGAVGELCLSGPQVAEGYWNLPEKTQDVFPTVCFPDGTERRIYRTGDLVRYNPDDQLEYLGRLDFQVKLHGFRIELGEIDTRAMAFEGVRQAISQVKQERIVLYYVADRQVSEDALRSFLAETLAEYMVPSIYMPLEELPLTANGKVNLKALPEPKLQDAEFTAPETEMEAEILRIVKTVLGFRDIGTTTNLVSAGMSSLDTMRLNAALAKEFGSSFMISEILKAPTVRGIAELEEQYTGAGQALQHYSERSRYPITENQRGVYLDWEMNSDTTQYNMPGVYVFRNIDPQVLSGALAEVLNTHSYLKMRLVKEAGVIMQQPHNDEAPHITVETLDTEPDTEFFQKLVKPFDLLSDRLYRANIYTWQDKTWLFMDVHHIVCDGLSFGVLFDDLTAVMKGGKSAEEQVTAYDYALYEEEVLSGSTIKLAEEYFGELIGEAQAVSYPDSETPDQKPNGFVEYAVPQKPIDDFCRSHEVTPGSFLQAAFALVLKRLSREERPLYLTVSNGRSDPRLANTVGMFVKTLPAVYAGGEASETAEEYVEKTFRQLQEIYSREMIPYTWLSDKYKLRAEIMFSYQGGISDEVEGAEGISLAMDKAKFPVMVTVLPENGCYRVSLEYDGMRYSKTDMQQLVRAVGTAAISLSQAEKLRDVKLVDETEAAELLRLGSGDELERDESETILTLLQKRVAATPDAPAVVFRDKTLTYREVDEITNRLAVYLQKTWQIGPEENIGVLIDRSELMMLYPFAIMKTGAAYMPLDPHFPTERLTFMCEDAAVRLILSEGTMLEEKLPEYTGARFKREELSALPEVTAEEVSALPGPQAHNRLVIIFTSGTTGKPKAVDLEHYGVVNFCYWYVKEFELTPSDRVAGYANFGFDAHMIDLYPSVMAGCAVYIFDEAMRLDILAMNDYMEENGISVAFMTTQIGCLISEMNHSLRYLSTGGEKMPPVTPPDFRFLNVYGPTECSLFSTYYDVPGYFEGKLIGRPLTNYQLYVIDQANQLVPRGAQGELLISGQGVARGYMNRPELTAEKFIDFKPLPSCETVKAYRSGDLVRWSEDGNIEYLGRIDKQVKLRGLRIELGEIENRVASYPGISQTVVEVKGDNNPRLCCYYVSESEIDIDALKAFLGETLTSFMIPEVYIRLEGLTLNANGKVDRRALPEPTVVTEEIVAPETEDEKKVFKVVAETLGTEAFGATSNLISLGMSSIAAMRLAAALESGLGIPIRVGDILKQPTVREIAEFGKAPKSGSAEEIRLCHVSEREFYPITENQRGLLIDWEMNRDTTQYNIPNVYVIEGVSAETLAEAVRKTVDLHPYLKTRLVRGDEDVLQQPNAAETVDVPVTALDTCPDAGFFQKLVVPFDLLGERLYRFHIYTYEQQVYLFMDIHHIIYDGLSSIVILSDIFSACRGGAGTAETITAYDYAVYEQDFLKSKAFTEVEKYYDELLGDVTSASYPNSAKPDLQGEALAQAEGATVGTLIRKLEAETIEAFCRKYAVTTGNYLQAAFAEALQYLTDEDKPMYVTISNGRSADVALQNTVGMYVRTLPVVFAGKGRSHREEFAASYVQAVQNQLQMTFAREIYPYTRIVERHRLHADIMMAWQGGMEESQEPEGARSIPLTLDAAKLPILVTAYPEGDNYVLMLEYDKARFSQEDMDLLLSCTVNVARSMTQAERIKDITFLSEENEEAYRRFTAGREPKVRKSPGLMQIEKMQVTGGKIDRSALPDLKLVSSVPYTEPENEMERIVAEKMQKVLGMSDPVGALDNFFELGGDSIKAIRMVSLIRQAGYKVQVPDIMNQKTVRKIASVLQTVETSGAISQKPFEGAIPDTAIVRYFKYLEQPDPHHNDQSTLWVLLQPCDKAVIQQAVNAVTRQHDMLRAVYRNDGLYVRPADTEIVVNEAEVSSEEEITQLCGELQASIRMEESLVSITLIHEGEHDYLFMAAHHLVIDGVSWRIISSDLETALDALKKGEKVSLPMKTSTYNDYANALHLYRDSHQLSLEIPYWENVQRELLSMPVSHEKDYGRDIQLVSSILDESTTLSFTKANFGMMNADINDALLTAVCMSYYAMTREKSVSVQLEGHGREDIGGSLVTDRTVGWFTSIYPVIIKNISSSLQSTFIEVKETLHRIPNKGVGYNVLRFLEGRQAFPACGDQIARIGFNYLGEMDIEQASEDSFLGTSDIPIGPSLSPRNGFGTDISINALVENGKFGLYVTYNAGIYDKAQMERFAGDILNNMTSVVQYLASLTMEQITASDLGETEWTDREFRRVVSDFASRGETIRRIYPLTPMQEGMLFKHLSEPKSWAYRIVTVFELDVLPTEEQLTAALDRLAKKHEVLRTAIIYDGVKKPRQAIIERRLLPIMEDLSSKEDTEAAVDILRIRILDRAFELQRKPLFQLTCAKKDRNSCYLIFAVHHAIVDGWCMGIYTGDFFTYLNEEITGIRTQDTEPETGKYEKAVREILNKDKTVGLAYWRKLLEDYETRTEIPSFGDVPQSEQSAEDWVEQTLDKSTTDRFLALCSSAGATISNGIELAWGLVLQTYSRTEDAVFAKVVSGRDNTGTDVSDLVGLFINSVPVRVKVGAKTTARELLRELQIQATESNKYDFLPLIEIQQQSELGADLFQNIVAFENYDSGLDKDNEVKLAFNIRPFILKEENFDEVTPKMYMDDEERLCLNLTFNRKHYRKEEIETVARLFEVLIEEMVQKPDCPIVNLSRVSEAELPAVIALSKGEDLPYDTSKTWLDLFDEQVKRDPAALAVEDEFSSMTYGELDHASDQVATWLISQGIRENDFVAVKMGRVKEFVAAIVGIQKAGAAYVPIDLSYPAERIAYMEADAGAKITLTGTMMPGILATEAGHVNRTGPDNFAYMIYTSGSTGTPKGAVLHQKGLMNFTVSMIQAYGYNRDDRISSHRSFSFDSHINDYYPALSCGGSVHIMPERIRKDPNQIYQFLEEHRITGGGYTTALAKIMKNEYPLKQRFIAFGGEALQGVVSDDVICCNGYGPTECTCDTSLFILEKGVTYDALPIGRPIQNCYSFLVDPHGNLVPPGVRGEICVAGPQVGYGYWNQPEKTAAVFEDCPFVEGTRMYHTGDLGYFNRDGQLMYAGRIDFQVKLHGYRIELGEIENRALQYTGMKLVCAMVKKDTLVLYYTAEADVDTGALKAFMAETLAEYMVPTVYLQLEQMPMTPNGKINRRMLPEPEISNGMQNVPPENAIEEQCLRIAREVLPGIEFGVTDDLMAAGLNSLNAMLLTSRISSELLIKLRVSDIMRYKTIRGFAQGKRRVAWLYEEYDENKPTIVFIQGIVLLNDTGHLHKLLSEFFNVLIIEPIQNHYESIFPGDHYDEVVAFYLTAMRNILPEDAKLFGFMGFSFGGEVAFGMAENWKVISGQSVIAIMGDSTLPKSGRRTQREKMMKKTSVQKLWNLVKDFEFKEHDYTQEELQTLADLTNMVNDICSENSLRPYDGKVIFLNAHKNSTVKMMKDKLRALRQYAPNAECHEFYDYTHAGIFTSEELHPFYHTLVTRLLRESHLE